MSQRGALQPGVLDRSSARSHGGAAACRSVQEGSAARADDQRLRRGAFADRRCHGAAAGASQRCRQAAGAGGGGCAAAACGTCSTRLECHRPVSEAGGIICVQLAGGREGRCCDRPCHFRRRCPNTRRLLTPTVPFKPRVPTLTRTTTTLSGKLIKPVHGSQWAVVAGAVPILGWTILLQLGCCDASLPADFVVKSHVRDGAGLRSGCAPCSTHRVNVRGAACRLSSVGLGGLTRRTTRSSLWSLGS